MLWLVLFLKREGVKKEKGITGKEREGKKGEKIWWDQYLLYIILRENYLIQSGTRANSG